MSKHVRFDASSNQELIASMIKQALREQSEINQQKMMERQMAIDEKMAEQKAANERLVALLETVLSQSDSKNGPTKPHASREKLPRSFLHLLVTPL